jgi:hypothetical protein
MPNSIIHELREIHAVYGGALEPRNPAEQELVDQLTFQHWSIQRGLRIALLLTPIDVAELTDISRQQLATARDFKCTLRTLLALRRTGPPASPRVLPFPKRPRAA